MRESVRHLDKNVIFRETFNDAFTVSRNGGIQTDMTYSEGKGIFDGATGNIQYIGNKTVSITGTFTIVCKFKTSQVAAADIGLVDSGYDGTGGIFLIRHSVGQSIRYGFKSNGTFKIHTGTTTINDGLWHTAVCVFDGTDIYGYMDGVSDNGSTGAGGLDPSIANLNLLAVGIRSGATNEFEGDIEYLDIYNVGLTSDEVALLYENTLYEESNLTQNTVLDIDSRLGAIYDKMGNAITNTDVVIRKDTIYCQYFEGTTSNLNLGVVAGLQLTSITVVCWVRLLSSAANSRAIVACTQGTAYGWGLAYHGATDDWRWAIDSNGSIGAWVGINSDNNVIIGKWTCLIGTYDEISTKIELYIDGEKQSGSTTVASIDYRGTDDTTIGSYDGGASNIAANMSQERIFNKALTQQEILQLYNSTKRYYYR